MSFLRNVRELLAEAHHEAWLLADRAMRWVEERFVWQDQP